VQYQLFSHVYNYFQQNNPHTKAHEIKAMTLEYVTHPDINTPPHSTGAAVDLTLWDNQTQEYIDMGSPINYPADTSWTYNFDTLTSTQISNRLFLTGLMLEAGFANLASEWWHFSYGDPRWAVFYDEESLYGLYDQEYRNSTN
jgi:zinc D-Ala-D-Ala dipeptidase